MDNHLSTIGFNSMGYLKYPFHPNFLKEMKGKFLKDLIGTVLLAEIPLMLVAGRI